VFAAAARVLDGAALIMRAVAEGGAAAAGPLREAALAEGAMLHHLHTAVTAQASVLPQSCGKLLLQH
jgi:DnaJ homolog subfamily C member 13